MTLITGTRVWTLTVRGAVPPGVPEEAVVQMLLTSVNVPLHMIPHMRESQVTFGDSTPPPPGLKMA